MNIPFADHILARFDSLSPQMQTAARYILDNPSDVALLTMREQARRAGVQPATMTRFAKQLGLDGFDDVRALYGSALRESQSGFAARARKLAEVREPDSEAATGAAFVDFLGASVHGLADMQLQVDVALAVDLLFEARRIYCFGVRSCLPAAWHFQYMVKLLGRDVVYLDNSGDTGLDPLALADENDILVAFSLQPYSERAVRVCDLCKRKGVKVLALTDSQVSPVARLAHAFVAVPIDSPGPFPSLGPMMVLVELLSMLLAERLGDAALKHLEQMDQHQNSLATYHNVSRTRT